jgi:hypothetical protein
MLKEAEGIRFQVYQVSSVRKQMTDDRYCVVDYDFDQIVLVLVLVVVIDKHKFVK